MYEPMEDDEPMATSDPSLKGISNVKSNSVDPITEWLEDDDDGMYDEKPAHELDNLKNKKLHARLMSWFEQEKERQAVNRFQMATDEDFYDSLQWSEEDTQTLIARGQAPLVYNQIKPTIDWLIGTEKRTRMDFKILPREEDDVKGAEAKTKLLKYQSDVNKEAFARSRAFADAIKAGMGIMEDGVRGDPTEEPIYSRYENWRNCLHDSNAIETDGLDMRYFFRWRWVDTDIAEAMFPDREDALRTSTVGAMSVEEEQSEDFWYLGARPADAKDLGTNFNRHAQINNAAYADNRRERIRLIEVWYRVPVPEKVIYGEVFDGEVFDAKNPAMARMLEEGTINLFDRITMRVYCAMMTEGHLLQNVKSPYRHNRIPFTIYWGYRRKRDNLPYGVIRAIRDPQEDLNKRLSKALHILSTKQVIMESGAVDDIDELREEVAAPDGIIVKNKGKELIIQRDDFELQHQAAFIDRDATAIREVGGVNAESLGRDTNANSGKAIIAKQDQGGLVTAELFDNLLLGFQLQGEIKLSLTEQFYSAKKMIRIVGSRGKLDWLKINYPDEATGEMLNDITARSADFVVGEQDYRMSVRLAMFETLSNIVGKLNPDIAVQFLDLLVEVGDIPEKEEFLKRIRKINGQTDPDTEPTPEEVQAIADDKEKQAKVEAFTEQMALADLEAKKAATRRANAEAAAKEMETTIGSEGQPDMQGMLDQHGQALQQQFEQQIADIQRTASQQESKLSDQIAALKLEAVNKLADAEVKAKSDHKKNVSDIVKAHIEGDTKVEIAKIEAAAAEKADKLNARLEEMAKQITEMAKGKDESGKDDKVVTTLLAKVEELSKQIADIGKGETKEGKDAPAQQPFNLVVNVDASKPTKKTGTLVPDGKGGFKVESQEVDSKDKN